MAEQLSADPEVTARALMIYDEELPAQLVEELQKVIAEAGEA
jgi:predicted regulator of amino acid metabolism with ACT domain